MRRWLAIGLGILWAWVLAISSPLEAQVSRQDGYQITLRFVDTGFSQPQIEAITAAAQRWQQIITTDLPDYQGGIPESLCTASIGRQTPAYPGVIDDLLIDILLDPDSSGGFSARARPCRIRQSNGLPLYGVMQFKAGLLARDAERPGVLYKVALHEMGHVLGIVPTDPRFQRQDPAVYIGSQAVNAYRALGGQGFVPVEDCKNLKANLSQEVCLRGSGGGHWKTQFFAGELMSAAETAPVISIVSVGALADLGYGVNGAAADPYRLPANP